ncbi:MAG: prepilin-type N-terminal cleavage/methylation domain-containing protein [Candidatus Sulfotelmatobacter sp.]|jgi:prepilin-type N-terminal cleavage/methylation domain-containing protein
MTRRNPENRKAKRQQGFTLVEVMIAIVIMTISTIGLMAVFGAAVGATQSAQEDLIARQKALEAMESIYTARNTAQISFAQIANLPTGQFVLGASPLLQAGPDGLVGTADDVPFPANGVCPAGPECYPMPGPDGILGTADDVPMSLSNFTRSITINNVLESDGVTINPNLKQIVVVVSYTKAGLTVPRSYTVQALISSYR